MNDYLVLANFCLSPSRRPSKFPPTWSFISACCSLGNLEKKKSHDRTVTASISPKVDLPRLLQKEPAA
jgi:hypothetical protein